MDAETWMIIGLAALGGLSWLGILVVGIAVGRASANAERRVERMRRRRRK